MLVAYRIFVIPAGVAQPRSSASSNDHEFAEVFDARSRIAKRGREGQLRFPTGLPSGDQTFIEGIVFFGDKFCCQAAVQHWT